MIRTLARRHRQRCRHRQSGLAMVIVITILAALLAGGAVVLMLQLGGTKQAGLVKNSKAAMFCAEAGLQDARALLQANRGLWNNILDTDSSNNPSWYVYGTGISGEVDDPADGDIDYYVTVHDDQDGTPMTSDDNGRIFVTSRCVKYPQTPSEIMELIDMSGQAHSYRNQAGQGPGNTGNANQ